MNIVVEKIIEQIELDKSYYNKAEMRYDSLGEFLKRENSPLNDYEPEVFVQGSFMLGTAVKPLKEDPIYDLDMSLILKEKISKQTHTQSQLRNIVRDEIERYRTTNNVKKELEEKRRCTRMEYSDTPVNFHMDIVAGIPSDEDSRNLIMESFKAIDSSIDSQKITSTTINITDNEDKNYHVISNNWRISNPRGYADWFKDRVSLNSTYEFYMEKANVEPVPKFLKPSILQKVVQILKRHRDVMFEDSEDSKPISIIITTLAARAYSGEKNLFDALINISLDMENHINQVVPRVPNPVNPNEDFSDKWDMQEYKEYRLEENFRSWLLRLNNDLNYLQEISNGDDFVEEAYNIFRVNLKSNELIGVFKANLIKEKEVVEIDETKTSSPWLRG